MHTVRASETDSSPMSTGPGEHFKHTCEVSVEPRLSPPCRQRDAQAAATPQTWTVRLTRTRVLRHENHDLLQGRARLAEGSVFRASS